MLGMDADTGGLFLMQQIQVDVAHHREIFVGMTQASCAIHLPEKRYPAPSARLFSIF
jgi:hypothetical protein